MELPVFASVRCLKGESSQGRENEWNEKQGNGENSRDKKEGKTGVGGQL